MAQTQRATEWQKRRGELNHDWLKNRLIMALAKWLNVIDGDVEDPGFQSETLRLVLREWAESSPKIVALLRDVESEISPRSLFEEAPLDRCDPETLRWLPPLCHGLWLSRCGIRTLVGNALDAAGKADRCYGDLAKSILALDDLVAPECARPLRPTIERFRRACRELGQAISRLPSEVLVT